MDQSLDAESRASLAALWHKARAMRVPKSVWVVLGLFLVAAVLLAVHTAMTTKDASLRLKVQHGLRSADLFVWVDADLAYSGKLIGQEKKKFGILDSVQGSLSETLPITSGTHQVRVRVASDDGSAQEDAISGDFIRNGQRTLSVNARRNDVSLSWQGSSTTILDPAPSGPGWISRYGGTLLLTVAGSIVSALTGYAIRELPKQIASREPEAPKT